MSAISSMICKNFAQNAWKRDLCSNCFKSEVEHNDWMGSTLAPVAQESRANSNSNEDGNTSDQNIKANQLANHSAIKPLSIKNQKNSNQTKKLSNNVNTNANCVSTASPQILMNTKKIITTHVSTNNSQLVNGIQNNNNITINKTKETIKQFNNTNKDCNDLRKRCALNGTSSEESEAKNTIISKDSKNFPQLKDTKLLLSQNNLRNAMNINNKCLTIAPVLSDSTDCKGSTTMPLIGILKSDTDPDLIKYRPKAKCLVFKEGDPLIIGYRCDGYGSDDNEDMSDEYEDEESDDEYDDPLLYSSDDKDLRELTRINTKFNSNFANFSINETQVKQTNSQTANQSSKPVTDSKVNLLSDSLTTSAPNCLNSTVNGLSAVGDNGVDCSNGQQPEPIVINGCESSVESIPKVCELLVRNGLNESFDAINSCNNTNCSNNCEIESKVSYVSTNNSEKCDVTPPMSTSSDSYSSGDEKDDQQIIDVQKNFRQNPKLIEASDSKTDSSESDNSSTNSDSGIEAKELDFRQESHQQNRVKPQLPVKPNINIKSILIEDNQQTVIQNSIQTTDTIERNGFGEEAEDLSEEYSSLITVNENIYQEIYESIDCMTGINGKFVNNLDDNYSVVNGSDKERTESPESIRSNDKRELKLAELAQELEQVRYMKRPAPQPPKNSKRSEEQMSGEEVNDKKLVLKKSNSNPLSEKQLSIAPNTTSTSKHRFSSIRKLLHKKSSSDKSSKAHFTDSVHMVSIDISSGAGADRKAWKQSAVDRSNLKIVHPIDFVANNSYKIVSETQENPESRPEAPPRTPKPSRPSVPARRRNKSAPNSPPTRNPPPLPPTTPPPQHLMTEQSFLEPVVDMCVKNNLNEAYNQLAKSNLSNLMAIKSKIESTYTDRQFQWSDFEVTNAVLLGSALVYRDSIVSKTKQSVNLLVLDDCYSAPIVSQFRYDGQLVLVLDDQWTNYYLLNDITIESSDKTFEQKQINSVILQLYSILESLENNECTRLSENTINSIIVCASAQDILLIVPLIASNQSADSLAQTHITVHQFLAQVLAKLLPNSLFESVGHVLSQPSVQISQSKTIVQLIAFQIPVQEMTDSDGSAIDYWFDISRSKFINQFCCLLKDPKLLTQLDYIYLKFLCNSNNTDLIRNSIALMIDSNASNSCK